MDIITKPAEPRPSGSGWVVSVKQTDEGFSVWVPGLPGCWSQGDTEAEALDNIREHVQASRELALAL